MPTAAGVTSAPVTGPRRVFLAVILTPRTPPRRHAEHVSQEPLLREARSPLPPSPLRRKRGSDVSLIAFPQQNPRGATARPPTRTGGPAGKPTAAHPPALACVPPPAPACGARGAGSRPPASPRGPRGAARTYLRSRGAAGLRGRGPRRAGPGGRAEVRAERVRTGARPALSGAPCGLLDVYGSPRNITAHLQAVKPDACEAEEEINGRSPGGAAREDVYYRPGAPGAGH